MPLNGHHIKIKITLAILCFTLFAFIALQNDYIVDPNSSIKFDGGKVKGTFSGLKGKITFNEDDLKNSKIEVEVEVNTIKTGKSGMDDHAKKEDWLDSKKYPKISFQSFSIAKTNAGYSVFGELEMHGVKKVTSIPFTFQKTVTGGIFTGSFKVNRKDYGIKGNSFGFLVSDIYTIELRVPAVKQ